MTAKPNEAAPGQMASVEPLLKSLPRLAYVGDVPVEASYHGSALLYRLMADYPTGQLTIVEAGLERSKVERRIENAIYLSEPVPCSRLNSTRFHLEYEALRIVTARFLGRRLADRLKPFKPEAIVTVSHGVSWIAAAHAARILDVPFHLICHDEWAKLPSKIIGQSSREELFGRTYRAAHSRLCVSPFMEENYGRRFGETGTVLYPSRDKLEPSQDGPQARAAKTGDGLICTFAGSINSPGYVGALTRVADELAKIRGQLEIFGPVDAEAGARAGLNKPNIRFRGMVPSAQLIETLRRESDILYVPMSFEARDRLNMELSFPSKLTDYTLTGLPLLISGPDYCSAVQWAEKYEGVAECVTEVEGNGLAEALRRLTDPAHRLRVGRRAAEIGEELFSYERAIATFYRALQKSPLFVEASLDNEA